MPRSGGLALTQSAANAGSSVPTRRSSASAGQKDARWSSVRAVRHRRSGRHTPAQAGDQGAAGHALPAAARPREFKLSIPIEATVSCIIMIFIIVIVLNSSHGVIEFSARRLASVPPGHKNLKAKALAEAVQKHNQRFTTSFFSFSFYAGPIIDNRSGRRDSSWTATRPRLEVTDSLVYTEVIAGCQCPGSGHSNI